jgi:23S rRNA (guanosine2251-2'-O)-methyltransferase
MSLTLRNPHSVLAALQHRPHDVLDVRVPQRGLSAGWEQVVELARTNDRPVRTAVASSATSPSTDGHRHSLAVGMVQPKPLQPLNLVLPKVEPQDRGVWLALDCVQDPQNLGAILRSAAFFGIRGVLLTKDRSAPLSSTVYDVASGGIEWVPMAMVANLSQAFEQARDAGYWILGASEHATTEITQVVLDRPRLLVIGNEERGLRRLTIEGCDELCAIRPTGGITSLNASVAAAVLMSWLTRPSLG